MAEDMQFLRFFTFVSWGYFPSTNLVDRAVNCNTSLYFYFSSFSMFLQSRISKSVICYFCSFLCSFYSLSFPSYSFLYSSFHSLFSVLLSPSVYFSDLPYCFLFKSVILSFFFSYYSILSAASSPLFSITIPSVLFLY